MLNILLTGVLQVLERDFVNYFLKPQARFKTLSQVSRNKTDLKQFQNIDPLSCTFITYMTYMTTLQWLSYKSWALNLTTQNKPLS